MHRFLVGATLALAVSLAACSSDPLGPDFEQGLTRQGGCGDVFFFAVDTEDEVMLTFRADGLVEDARSLGEPTETTFEFPAAAATLIVEQGSRISDAACDDVIENGGPQVEHVWSAVDGRATVTIRPDLTGLGAYGDLVLEDVVVEDAGGKRVVVDRMEWTNVLVGWFAG